MFKIIYLSIFFLFFNIIFSQNQDEKDFEEVEQIKEVVKLGEFEKASQSLDSILMLNPKNIYALQLKGSIYANSKEDFTKAIEYYKASEDIYPNDAINLSNIGKNYFKLDSIQKGEEYITKAYDLDSTNEYIRLQYAFYVLKDVDDKIKFYEETVLISKIKEEFQDSIYENSLDGIYNNLGYNYYLKQEFVKSALTLTDGLKYDYENVDLLNNLGNSLQRLNYLELAIYYYDLALKIEPSKTFSLNGKANSYQRLGVIDSACVNWQKALDNGYKYKKEWKDIWDIEDPKLMISKFCEEEK